jgi:fructose-1,6-bisphosphatase/inositol monophosphatase family enzyme
MQESEYSVIPDPDELLAQLRAIHATIRDTVVFATERQSLEQLAVAVAEEGGDTIFAIDRVSEGVLLQHFATLAERWPMVLIAEGLGESGRAVLPEGADEAEAQVQVIVDPIDGTRGLMYQKRPAFILTGVAPNRGRQTSLADIELALMTEVPLVKQHLCDQLWARRGEGVGGERLNRLTGVAEPLAPRPSQATSLLQGFGSISRFFPGARDVLAAIEEELIAEVLGPQPAGAALAFEDQYISTGGQLYELLMGHDRWVADIRPLIEPILAERGRALGICCHPYDICTELIAREAGLLVTDATGQALDAPLDVHSPVSWAGYANQRIAALVAPALRGILVERGLLDA